MCEDDLIDDHDEDEADVLPCPSCGQMVYEDSDQCPYCGDWIIPLSGQPRWTRLVGAMLVVALLLGLIGLIRLLV